MVLFCFRSYLEKRKIGSVLEDNVESECDAEVTSRGSSIG